MRVHKAVLALYCATGANAFVAPAVVEPRTTRLRHHKVKSQVAVRRGAGMVPSMVASALPVEEESRGGGRAHGSLPAGAQDL
jgi:hypothetical protein